MHNSPIFVVKHVISAHICVGSTTANRDLKVDDLYNKKEQVKATVALAAALAAAALYLLTA